MFTMLVPTVIDKEPGGERVYDIYSRLLKDRIIFLGTGVEPTSANLVIAQLLYLDAQDKKKPIHLYVNSPGGSVTCGLAIVDTMKHINAPVSTISIGLSASAGALILSSGEKGMRYSLPNSEIMIHQPKVSNLEGQVTDIEIYTKLLLENKERLNKILAENTGQPLKKIREDAERDFFMTPEEAKKYGLIDKVITKSKV